MILPICKFLEKRVQQEVPNSKNSVMYQGINPLNWYHVEKLNLKHPCVGILQSATIWGKAQEMLILPEILRKNPKIMFYWVGDGPYREKILSALNNFENFKWIILNRSQGCRIVVEHHFIISNGGKGMTHTAGSYAFTQKGGICRLLLLRSLGYDQRVNRREVKEKKKKPGV